MLPICISRSHRLLPTYRLEPKSHQLLYSPMAFLVQKKEIEIALTPKCRFSAKTRVSVAGIHDKSPVKEHKKSTRMQSHRRVIFFWRKKDWRRFAVWQRATPRDWERYPNQNGALAFNMHTNNLFDDQAQISQLITSNAPGNVLLRVPHRMRSSAMDIVKQVCEFLAPGWTPCFISQNTRTAANARWVLPIS